jgi:hypothetical protein
VLLDLLGLDGRSGGLSAMAAERSKTVLRRGDLEVPASKDPIGWPPTGRTACIMICLSWNCRGLGSVATMKEFRELVKNVAPTVLCVLETQVHRSRVEGLKNTLGFDNAFAVSSACSGRSGGLGVFWNNNTRVEIIPYSQYHIDSIISENGVGV